VSDERQRILVIDDSDAIHALLRARLAGEPVDVAGAYDGASGLAKAFEAPPDLILLDVDMPGLDGFEVCRQLKASSRTMAVPIIFLTGAASTEQKITGLELGAVDYVTKPFDPAELKARVRGSLRTKYLLDLLERKAQIDGLTGLWNRRYFDARLAESLSIARRGHRPLSLLLADIDRFKSINDQYGHTFGDEVLRRVALCLSETGRLEDVSCRYGGEEFAVIAADTNREGAAHLGERLRHAVEDVQFDVRGRGKLNISASFGVTSVDDAGSNDEPLDSLSRHLIDAADNALYEAKRTGRNRVVVASPQVVATAS
jgi:diguanylate cyclase (GGDEF)-like protein